MWTNFLLLCGVSFTAAEQFSHLHRPQYHSPSPALTVRGGRRRWGWCSLTIGVVDGPDLEGGHVGKDADELLGLQSRGPLVLGVLVKSEGVLLCSDTGHGVALGKDVRGDPLARALNNYVHHGRTSRLLPDLEFKGQELVVAEPLVPKVAFCSEKKKLMVSLTASSFQMLNSLLYSLGLLQTAFVRSAILHPQAATALHMLLVHTGLFLYSTKL